MSNPGPPGPAAPGPMNPPPGAPAPYEDKSANNPPGKHAAAAPLSESRIAPDNGKPSRPPSPKQLAPITTHYQNSADPSIHNHSAHHSQTPVRLNESTTIVYDHDDQFNGHSFSSIVYNHPAVVYPSRGTEQRQRYSYATPEIEDLHRILDSQIWDARRRVEDIIRNHYKILDQLAGVAQWKPGPG